MEMPDRVMATGSSSNFTAYLNYNVSKQLAYRYLQ